MPTPFPSNFIKVNGKLDGLVFKGGVFYIHPAPEAGKFLVSLEIDKKYGELNRWGYEYVRKKLSIEDASFDAIEIREMLACLNGEHINGKDEQKHGPYNRKGND